jgi:hypothetical protein
MAGNIEDTKRAKIRGILAQMKKMGSPGLPEVAGEPVMDEAPAGPLSPEEVSINSDRELSDVEKKKQDCRSQV